MKRRMHNDSRIFRKRCRIWWSDWRICSHGPYCIEVEVHGTDNEGFEYSAIGISDGDEITEIDVDSIECIGSPE